MMMLMYVLVMIYFVYLSCKDATIHNRDAYIHYLSEMKMRVHMLVMIIY